MLTWKKPTGPMFRAFLTLQNYAGNDRLCGGIPELQLPKCISTHSNSGRHKLSLALIISMSTLVGAIVVTCLIIYSCIKRRKDQMPRSSLKELFLKLSYERLLKATDGFSSENLIGTGSFSSVYKGVIDEVGLSVVAIKVLNLQRRGGSRSFVAECEALRNIRHRNLLKVITSCSSIDFQGNDFKAVVYEFMPNGSLEGWLNPSTGSINELPKLGFLQRINIAIDVAYAIDYLHHHCGKTIVHCDLKPSNILLDKDMIAHVGDFGLAKLLLPEISNANQSSSSIGVRGTVGYAAPEYGLGSEVSTKGDVYSYGILLLEMLTGKKPTDSVFEGGLTLHNYARTALVNSVLDIMDSALLVDDDDDADVFAPEVAGSKKTLDKEASLISLVKLGVACSMDSPQDRMDISSVIDELRLIRDMIPGMRTDSHTNILSGEIKLSSENH